MEERMRCKGEPFCLFGAKFVFYIFRMALQCFWKTCPGVLLLCLVVLAIVLAELHPALLFALENEPKQVLVLHSYHAGLYWTDDIMAGIREVFALQPIPHQVYVEYMDSRRNESPEYLSQILDDFLTRKLKDKRFDLILLSDNDALNFIRHHRRDLFAGVPIIFCGINNFTPSLIEGMGGVTGVAEMPEVGKTIALALNLHPQTEEIIVIGRTEWATGPLNYEPFHAAARDLEGTIPVTFWNDVPLEELQSRLPRLGTHHLVFLASEVKTASGQTLSFVDSVRKVREVSTMPLYSFWEMFLGEGIVGGKLVSGLHQGRLAAQLAMRVLNGENPETIEVATAKSNANMFDYRELKRFGLSPSVLPEGSVVVHRPPPFYKLSKNQMWAALFFLLSLSVALLVAMLGRMRAEKALRISEERFRSVIDSSPMGIHQYQLEPDGRLVLTGANPATDTMLEVENQALIGKTLEEAFPGRIDKELPVRFREICAQGRLWHAEPIAYKNKTYEVFAFPTGPGTMACMFSDISERKRAQDQIRESRQMLQLVLDYIPQYVFWKDLDSVYLGCNRNFAKAAGVETPQELIGKTDYDLAWKKDEADSFREYDRRVMKFDTPELHIIESQRHADGKQAWLDTNKIPLHDGEGQVVGILGTYEDITERRLAENALRESETKLKEANRELETFTYTVSHDLRTPLTVILGYADLLQKSLRDRLNEQELNSLSIIHDSGIRMVELMEDLLDLAKAGQIERPTEPCNTEEVVNEVVFGLTELINEVDVSVAVGALPTLRVPRTLLFQILHNLIGNALRYGCKPGDVIEVGGDRKGEKVQLYVRDHGAGVPEEERGRIFEVFYRGTTRKNERGTGIGLATVQKIARLFDGRAWVEETPGGGSTFWVEMVDVSVNTLIKKAVAR